MTTIGERLEDARKKKGISIREAAEATKIRGDYLQKFESNLFDIGLTDIYTRGFLRTYAQYLKLPAERLLNDYAALGHGEVRPRQPSREVYGRMDLTISSGDDRPERSAPPSAEPTEEKPRAQPHFPRTRSNLPEGPAIDPVLLNRIFKWGGGAIVALLLVWAGTAIFGGKSAQPPAESPKPAVPVTNNATAPVTPANTTISAAPAANEQTVIITARDDVTVQAWAVVNTAGTNGYGAVLLKSTILTRGQSTSFTKTGAAYLFASAQENIQIEYNGQRLLPSSPPYNFRGPKAITLP